MTASFPSLRSYLVTPFSRGLFLTIITKVPPPAPASNPISLIFFSFLTLITIWNYVFIDLYTCLFSVNTFCSFLLQNGGTMKKGPFSVLLTAISTTTRVLPHMYDMRSSINGHPQKYDCSSHKHSYKHIFTLYIQGEVLCAAEKEVHTTHCSSHNESISLFERNPK